METVEKESKMGGIYNYFQGATIHNMVINGNMTKSGPENYYQSSNTEANYSDQQIAKALANIVGKDKPIDSKQKWAGAMWLLRWECNFPAKAMDFCNRINALPLPADLEFKCEYNNIRMLSTLSFMNEDARDLENVKYKSDDKIAFLQMREVVIALRKELEKTRVISI